MTSEESKSPWVRHSFAECKTRKEAAEVYRRFLRECDADPARGRWEPPIVNAYLIARWSLSGLSYIKNLAWKGGAK